MNELFYSNPTLYFLKGGIFLLVGLIFYFLPSLIANKRKHRQYESITTLNLLLGWTFIGWVIALIWAVSYQEKKN